VRNPDGSWGYQAGQEGRPEPTLLAAMAGMEPPLAWLERRDLSWSRRLLPLVLWEQHGAEALVQAALSWLEHDRAQVVEGVEWFDASIPAWGWVEETAPWVEPTAHAMLSIKRVGRLHSPRLADGLRFLLKRQGEDGGWNYGNPKMLAQELESYPIPTAWALMALRGLPGTGSATDRAMAWLEGQEELSAHSMALLALTQLAYGRDARPNLRWLEVHQQAGGSWYSRVDVTALAVAAFAAAEGEPVALTR